MTHCASIRFVRGAKPGHNTGFDIDEADILEMEKCNGVVVASAIFENFDEFRQAGKLQDDWLMENHRCS
ncbi:uncharacterized protein DS421_3g91040 [Arachis hypogaea]|nr:uncharacterized protein DS421_3g91040 [Arachis hypogaea]